MDARATTTSRNVQTRQFELKRESKKNERRKSIWGILVNIHRRTFDTIILLLLLLSRWMNHQNNGYWQSDLFEYIIISGFSASQTAEVRLSTQHTHKYTWASVDFWLFFIRLFRHISMNGKITIHKRTLSQFRNEEKINTKIGISRMPMKMKFPISQLSSVSGTEIQLKISLQHLLDWNSLIFGSKLSFYQVERYIYSNFKHWCRLHHFCCCYLNNKWEKKKKTFLSLHCSHFRFEHGKSHGLNWILLHIEIIGL